VLRARFALLRDELAPPLREERAVPPLREDRLEPLRALLWLPLALVWLLLALLWLLLALLWLLLALLWLLLALVLRLLALRLLVPLRRALADDCLRPLLDPLLLFREADLDAEAERLRLLARFDLPRSLAADISPSCFRLTLLEPVRRACRAGLTRVLPEGGTRAHPWTNVLVDACQSADNRRRRDRGRSK
jgi:hypothetical protein